MTKSAAQYTLAGQKLVEQGLPTLPRQAGRLRIARTHSAAPAQQFGDTSAEISFPQPVEHLLFQQLEERLGTGAHSHNSLLRRIGSHAHALEREQSATLKK